MSARAVRLEDSWQALVGDQFEQPYMQALSEFLRAEKQQGKRIYPPGPQIFNALDSTPVSAVKVVIIGQDPYHGAGQAHGLCFSVQPGVELPPSLRNIYAEIEQDLGVPGFSANAGCLDGWASQGVLLLNAVLTVEHGRAGAHQGRGWEQFTDCVVARLSDALSGVVFLLWGGYAQKKGAAIDRNRHHVLTAPHPSPLSAHRGFFGCRHFSATNAALAAAGKSAIDWTRVR